MSILKSARAAAALAALTLPAHAVAAAPSAMPVLAASAAAAQDDAATEEGQPFFRTEYLIGTVIVIVLAITLYFVLEDDEGSTVSP